ncbi:hypothetical protein DFA_02035 [Cavenderia fasciculata]|uniref:Uncharacterized protein n=1 Tax=Cavenderia fasciculata TaxID=261658 RepID=F4PYI3_CACFS|nr:uncharacterized protein DFA_02035 [Cavenderia fasciculata]EGG19249.1 hypothetical protein DFA_02035 [Cavenderia fasciculata]|eukprot:XP_004357520.1 hypothetical protein DFA_02035 [Cavenderia fasciculata]
MLQISRPKNMFSSPTSHLQIQPNIDVVASCLGGDLEMVKCIIKETAQTTEALDGGKIYLLRDAIVNAMESGSLELVKYLDENIESCNIATEWNRKPGAMCRSQSLQVIEYFLSRVATDPLAVDAKCIDGISILCSLDVDLIKEYLSHKSTYFAADSSMDKIEFVWSVVYFLNPFQRPVPCMPNGMTAKSKGCDSIFEKIGSILPYIFNRSSEQAQILHNKITNLIMTQNNNNLCIIPSQYQPLYNMLLALEILAQDNNNAKLNLKQRIHSVAIRAIIELATLEQVKVFEEIDPYSLRQFSPLSVDLFHEDVFAYFVERGIITDEMIEDILVTNASVIDPAALLYFAKHKPEYLKQLGDWELKNASNMEIGAKVLIHRGRNHPTKYQETMDGIETLCYIGSPTDNFMIKYLVETKRCCDLYALGGAIIAGNFQLFDYIASIKDPKRIVSSKPPQLGGVKWFPHQKIERVLDNLIGQLSFQKCVWCI